MNPRAGCRGLVVAICGAVAWLASPTRPAAQEGRIVVPEIVPNVPPRGDSMREVPIGTAELSGVVTAAASGRPLGNVRLTLSGQAHPAAAAPGQASLTAVSRPLSRTVISDEQGRFVFNALPAGGFVLNAARDQYLSMAYGARGPGRPGTMIPVADGQRLAVSMSLAHGGVITGTIVGPDGEAIGGASVRIMRTQYANGIKRPQIVGGYTSDDRGIYRAANLSPGEYYVSAAWNASGQVEMARLDAQAFDAALDAARQGGRNPAMLRLPQAIRADPPAGFAATYYPGAMSIATATSIALAAGEERSGVDVTVLSNRAVNVTGIVAGVPPNAGVQVTIANDDPMSEAGTINLTRAAADGTFTLRNVVPGQYTITAQVVPAPVTVQNANGSRTMTTPEIDPAMRMWASASIAIDGEAVPKAVLTLQAPRSVSGTIQGDPSAAGRPGAVMVMLTPAQTGGRPTFVGGPIQATADADGTFTIAGVPAGTFAIRVNAPMRSAVYGGRDLQDFPLIVEGDRDISGVAITLGARRSELTGRLMDAAGAGAPDYTIIVAAADRQYWTPNSRRILTTRPALDGRYSFIGLPAGDYLVAAVTDLEPGQQFDPSLLQDLTAAAVRVTVPDNGQASQDLRLGR